MSSRQAVHRNGRHTGAADLEPLDPAEQMMVFGTLF